MLGFDFEIYFLERSEQCLVLDLLFGAISDLLQLQSASLPMRLPVWRRCVVHLFHSQCHGEEINVLLKLIDFSSAGTARHGLQSLGKVGASRRIPPPANLPSLKSENSGNDPTVSLVPSGGGGWGSTKEKASENPPTTSQPPTPSSTPSQANVPTVQQPLLQPQRPIPPPSHPQQPQPQSQNSGQTQTQPVKQAESQAKTWGTVSSNGAGGPGEERKNSRLLFILQTYCRTVDFEHKLTVIIFAISSYVCFLVQLD